MTLGIRNRRLDLSGHFECVWFHLDQAQGRAHNHRAGLYHSIVETGYPRRIARALARLKSGQPVDLPALGGDKIRLLPTPGPAPLPWTVEFHSSTQGTFPATEIKLSDGVYTFKGAARSGTLTRDFLADPFVLDTLVLAPSGAPMTAFASGAP